MSSLDIYIWSIEDRHEVRVQLNSMVFIMAAFSDTRIAHNFRNWVQRSVNECDLCALVYAVHHKLPLNAVLTDLMEQINTRRRHPTNVMDKSLVD